MKSFNVLVLACTMLSMRVSAAQNPGLSEAKSRVLEAVRVAALKYAHQLPDFICTQTTEREVTKGSPNFLSAMNVPPRVQPLSHDSFEEQLTYVGGKESYTVLSVNHRRAKDASHLQFRGAISAGEFGTVFTKVFNPASKTTFLWNRESRIDGRTVWEFRFHVPKEAGTAVIYRQDNFAVQAGYSGAIIVDPETYDVIELSTTVDVPASSPIQKIERKINYAVQSIGGRDCYLPVRSSLHMEQGYLVYDNQIEFKDYHRFISVSTLHYGDEAMR